MKDEHLNCSWKTGEKVCGAQFRYSVRDQEFYALNNFVKPKYCRPHREERKRQQQSAFGPALRQVRAEQND